MKAMIDIEKRIIDYKAGKLSKHQLKISLFTLILQDPISFGIMKIWIYKYKAIPGLIKETISRAIDAYSPGKGSFEKFIQMSIHFTVLSHVVQMHNKNAADAG
jgi:hypothetical protein